MQIHLTNTIYEIVQLHDIISVEGTYFIISKLSSSIMFRHVYGPRIYWLSHWVIAFIILIMATPLYRLMLATCFHLNCFLFSKRLQSLPYPVYNQSYQNIPNPLGIVLSLCMPIGRVLSRCYWHIHYGDILPPFFLSHLTGLKMTPPRQCFWLVLVSIYVKCRCLKKR